MNYISSVGIYLRNELSTIKKREKSPLQPLYEAVTNAWESIVERFLFQNLQYGNITIELHFQKDLFSDTQGTASFESLYVKDNGIGLNEVNYNRIINLRDNSKGHHNFGTGRVQFIHYFNETIIESAYLRGPELLSRSLTLSKSESFLAQNAILRENDEVAFSFDSSGTIVKMAGLLDDKDEQYYSALSTKDLKEELLTHYLSKLCDNRDRLPSFKIEKWVNGQHIIADDMSISAADLPIPDADIPFPIKYSHLTQDNKIEKSSQSENFRLVAFKQSEEKLEKNALFLVSKGEQSYSMDINNLKSNDVVDGFRYLFLLSGDYIDSIDSDERGNLQLLSAKEFRNQNADSLFPTEVILKDDIKDQANIVINEQFEEIKLRSQVTQRNITNLQKMFLLSNDTVAKIKNKVRNNDSDETILQMVYEFDSEMKAAMDVKLKEQVSQIAELNPSQENYQEQLSSLVNELTATIPLQNKIALSQYVAHRKLVLQAFEYILEREKANFARTGKVNEAVLHNLICRKSRAVESEEDGDLWIINEDYIYFKGGSDINLDKYMCNGESLIKENLTLEEEAYCHKENANELKRRPDILLFPDEGKCVIIEFKAIGVAVSEHLDQINKYARLIAILSKEKFHIRQFYGYLIGEDIDTEAVMDNNTSFRQGVGCDYLFRPNYDITNLNRIVFASLYTEILSYSSLLERAKRRNEIFIKKLCGEDAL